MVLAPQNITYNVSIASFKGRVLGALRGSLERAPGMML